MVKILFLVFAIGCSPLLAGVELISDQSLVWKNPTRDELVSLFTIATRRPIRGRYAAIVEEHVTFSQASIETAMEHVRLSRGNHTLSPVEEKRFRADFEKQARDHAHPKYVEEWYSHNFIRYDQFQEAAVLSPNKRHPTITETEIYNLNYSPYLYFRINRPIRSVNLYTTPKTQNRSNFFWSIFGMDNEFSVLVLDALGNITPNEVRQMAQMRYEGLERVQLNEHKIEALTHGVSKDWAVNVATQSTSAGEVRYYRLTGTWHIGPEAYAMETTLKCITIAGRNLFESGTSYNRSADRSYQSRMSDYDANGAAHTWEHTEIRGKRSPERLLVKIVAYNTNLLSGDDAIFRPPAIEEMPNYNFFAGSTGNPKLISKLLDNVNVPQSFAERRLFWIKMGFGAVTIVAAVIFWRNSTFQKRKMKEV